MSLSEFCKEVHEPPAFLLTIFRLSRERKDVGAVVFAHRPMDLQSDFCHLVAPLPCFQEFEKKKLLLGDELAPERLIGAAQEPRMNHRPQRIGNSAFSSSTCVGVSSTFHNAA